jgi:uncharacterized Zn finger protein
VRTDRPKECSPIELRRVGVIFTRREQSLKCMQCGAAWKLETWMHKRPRKY